MYKQVLDPVGDSLFLSALVAMIPLATLFILLGGLKLKAHIAGAVSLVVAILVAIIVYGHAGRDQRSRSQPRAPRSACSRSSGSSGTRSGSTT